MVILQLEIKNIGPLEEVNIVLPKSGIIEIAGPNEAGKTHILTAINYLLGGFKQDGGSPIKSGKRKGEIMAYLGESENGLRLVDGRVENYKYKLRRVFTEKGTRIQVESADGAVFKSPQSFIDGFLCDLAFDPLEFIHMKEEDQTETLLNAITIPFDATRFEEISGYVPTAGVHNPLDDLNKIYGKIYQYRTEINRDLDKARKITESIVVPESTERIDSVSVVDLMNEKNRLSEAKMANDWERKKFEQIVFEIKSSSQKIEDLKEEERRIRAMLEDIVKRKEQQEKEKDGLLMQYESQQKVCDALKDPDFSEIDRKIAEADDINRKARKYAEDEKVRELEIAKKQNAEREVAELVTESQALTEKLANINSYKEEILRKTEFPIKGLGFDDNGILTYDGMPLKRRGQSVQLLVSCAVMAALKPKLKVILSPSETQLDCEHREQLENWAIEHGFQIITCKVVEKKQPGVKFFIEDGKLNNAGLRLLK